MQISRTNIEELKKNGWTLVDMGLTNAEIKKYKKGVEELRNKAFKIKYPLTRCYYPHLRSQNIAAIESPFNHLINNNDLKEFFYNLKLGESIKKLMNWENVYLHLSRLFVMKGYKYVGNWHRDFDSWDGDIQNMQTIQVGIYLKDQDGFRIIKPKYDLWGSSNDRLKEDFKSDSYLTYSLPNHFYSEIKGKAGHLIFFAPGLLHQGNSSCERLDFHFRFSNNMNINYFKKNNYIFIKHKNYDFEIPNFYGENFNINKDQFTPRDNKFGLKRRLINSVNYYTGIYNIFRYFKENHNNNLSYPFRVNLKANTIFQ